MYNDKSMIKKVEKETRERFLYKETSNLFKFNKNYYYFELKKGTYQKWTPKRGAGEIFKE